MEPMITETSMDSGYPNRTRSASIVALLAGLWFLASPWVYGVYLTPEAWNNRIAGLLITIVAIARLSVADRRTEWLSWINCLLGIWVLASPWIFQYAANTDRLVNSLCTGGILFVAATVSAASTHKAPQPKF